MTKYTDMQARARKAGLWPISKEQAYYAGLEEGSAGHIRTDNGAVIERLERELDLTRDKYRTEQSLRAAVEREAEVLRVHVERLRSSGLALAFYQDDTDEYSAARHIVMNETPAQSLAALRAEAVESVFASIPTIGGRFRAVDIEEYAQQLRNGEDNE